MHHPKSHAANKKNVKSELQELDTRPITRSGGSAHNSPNIAMEALGFSVAVLTEQDVFFHGHLDLEAEIFSSVTPKHVWPPFP